MTQKSVFGKNFKYILALGALATLAYTSPAVLDSISSGIAYTQEQAAAFDAFKPGQIKPFNNSQAMKARFASSSLEMNSSSTIPMRPFASSTRPVGDQSKQGNDNQSDRKLNPQDVITILLKAGIISADKVDQARLLFPQPPMMGSSTKQVMKKLMPFTGSTTPSEMHKNILRLEDKDHEGSTTLRGLPPPPPITSTSTPGVN